jgi:6-phosphogluconolactonase (cycloisomerase 2 family)
VLTTSSLAGYSLSSGSLTAISGSSFTLSEASAIAIAPSGNFLYVASEGSGITLYTINTSTGALTDVGIIYSDLLSGALQIDPSGKWLLDASLGGTLTAVPITSAGAEDTTRALQQVALAGSTVHQMAISPNGALISVALGSTGTESFNFTASSNTPIGSSYSPIVPKGGSFGAAIAVAFDPQSRLLYVGETAAFSGSTNSGALRAFKPVTNGLNEISGSPYAPAGIGPHAILPDSTGSYVYAASWGSGASGSIAGYSVTTSALTAVGTAVATGTEPVGIAEDSTDSYVLLVNTAGSTPLNAYTFDGATLGQLDAFTVTGSPADNPIAVVAAP